MDARREFEDCQHANGTRQSEVLHALGLRLIVLGLRYGVGTYAYIL